MTDVIAPFPDLPTPEVARPCRTLKQRKAAILAHFDTGLMRMGPRAEP